MDAQQLKPEVRRRARPQIARFVAVWLAIVLAIGLWQGYGRWLLSGVDAF
jgi:hypothetical protein